MENKLFVCRECGYVFPAELSKMIEDKIQVYCEMCGTPFSLTGVEFKQKQVSLQKKAPPPHTKEARKERSRKNFSKAIQIIDKFAYLPILIFSSIFLATGWISPIPSLILQRIISSLLIGTAGLSIAFYDMKYISPHIKEERYENIVLDSFLMGILGCIIFGTGVILLIKGILNIVYVMVYPTLKDHRAYRFGLSLKNSLSYFSAKGGAIIGLLIIVLLVNGTLVPNFFYMGLDFLYGKLDPLNYLIRDLIIISIILGIALIPTCILIIDHRSRHKLMEKDVFTFGDSFKILLLGAFGTSFFAIGIFILLKGILLFFLFVGKPFDFELHEKEVKAPIKYPKKIDEVKVIQESYEIKEVLPDGKIQEIPPALEELERPVPEDLKIVSEKEGLLPEQEKEPEQIAVEDKKEVAAVLKTPESMETGYTEMNPEDHELRLHESLLPVKDAEDKKVVKHYFSKIFNVLSKDIRKRIMDLDIPKKEKKALLSELAYLSQQEQLKYIEIITELYREIPQKLISRIRKLPNVKPQYYDKIIEELKYLDFDEQAKFVQFLEENAK
jgi:hypothetical protein